MATPPSSAGDLVGLIKRSGLVSPEELIEHLEQLRSAGAMPQAPRELANLLVEDGLLTRFQTKQLLAGKHKGFILARKYKLLEHLGSGGMATVFLCEHIDMRRLVALKMLPVEQSNSKGALDRFRREARAAARLDHPNIVRAHDLDRQGDVHFLVMEFVRGTSLSHLVKTFGPLDVERACHYIAQAAAGLQHAHEAGLVHRDIKPGNLLLDRSGTVKILDMGLARFFNDVGDNLTREHDSRSVLGTADYMAPEQALDCHKADIRADIYSLGATLFYLLTGETLYGQGNAAQKLVRLQTEAPRSVRDLRPDVPEELADVIARMLARDPNQRYTEPTEVIEALGPWIQEPIPLPQEKEMPRHARAIEALSNSDTISMSRKTTPIRLPPMPATSDPRSNKIKKPAASKKPRHFLESLRSHPLLVPSLIGGLLLGSAAGFSSWLLAPSRSPAAAKTEAQLAPAGNAADGGSSSPQADKNRTSN